MGVFTTIRKKEDKEDERTVSATDFIERMVSMRREKEQLPDVAYTEMPKDKM